MTSEADIPHRDQIARVIATAISDAWWQRGGEKVSTAEQSLAAADALIREFEIYPRPGKEPRP